MSDRIRLRSLCRTIDAASRFSSPPAASASFRPSALTVRWRTVSPSRTLSTVEVAMGSRDSFDDEDAAVVTQLASEIHSNRANQDNMCYTNGPKH